MSIFKKATRQQAKVRLALTGPSGSGKTTSALRLARGLTDKRIAIIDTENKSASLFAGEEMTDARTGEIYKLDFDVCDVPAPYQAEKFIELINATKAEGYEVLIIDSFSHVWESVLEFKAKMDSAGGNSYTNWNAAGKKFSAVVDLVRSIDMHVICCMRSKMEHVLEVDAKGKAVPRKVGMAPIVREGTEYEFSSVLDIDVSHMARDTKGRLRKVVGDEPFMITEATGAAFREYLSQGEPPAPPPETWTDEKSAIAKSLVIEILAKDPKAEAKIQEIKSKGLAPSRAIDELTTLRNILNPATNNPE